MTLLARLGEQLPERNYLGIDVGYKEHVAVVITLQSFAQDGAECVKGFWTPMVRV